MGLDTVNEHGLSFTPQLRHHVGRLGEDEIEMLIVVRVIRIDQPDGDPILSGNGIGNLPAADPTQGDDSVDVLREPVEDAEPAQIDAAVMRVSNAGFSSPPA